MLRRVLEHQLEGVFPGALAHLREERDVAADERLQRRAERTDDAARADDDAAHDADVADDAAAGQLERGGDERGIDRGHGRDPTLVPSEVEGPAACQRPASALIS